MRGKLRDKRSTGKKETFKYGEKHDDGERRRPYKRDARPMIWQDQQGEDEGYDLEIDDVDDEELEQEGTFPLKK